MAFQPEGAHIERFALLTTQVLGLAGALHVGQSAQVLHAASTATMAPLAPSNAAAATAPLVHADDALFGVGGATLLVSFLGLLGSRASSAAGGAGAGAGRTGRCMLHAYTACLLLLICALAGLGLYARLSGAALRANLEQQRARTVGSGRHGWPPRLATRQLIGPRTKAWGCPPHS